MKLFSTKAEVMSDVYGTETFQQRLSIEQPDHFAQLPPEQSRRARAAGAVAMSISPLITLVTELQRKSERTDRRMPKLQWMPEARAWIFT